jgi:tetratricopeptide (TPR) repeat protein
MTVSALAVKLTGSEKEQVSRKETDSITAYDAFLKGWGHYLRHTPEDYAKAVSYFEKATEIDPNYGRAYASKALIYSRVPKLGKRWLDALYVFPTVADKQAKKYLKLSMKNPTSSTYRAASYVDVHDGRYEKAIADADRALSLDPNNSDSHESMAFALIMAGRPQEAFVFAKKAMRLDPHNLANPLYYIGLAHFSMKEFEKAVISLKRALTYSPQHGYYLLCLSAAYGQLGNEKEARKALARHLKISQLFNLREFGRSTVREYIVTDMPLYLPPFKYPDMTALFDEGLRVAGVDEPANEWRLGN